MTRRRTANAVVAVVALVFAAACGAGTTPSAGGRTETVTVTPSPLTPSTASDSPAASSETPSTPPAPTISETVSATATTAATASESESTTPNGSASAIAAPVLKQWTPPAGTAATGWPKQKCELPTTRDHVIPHFDTPQLAMTFLTQAYNCYDIVALKRVTVAAAREALLQMTTEATNLRLDKCLPNKARGDYDCTFTHDVPASAKSHDANNDGVGRASFVVGPATRSGWYMTVLEGCGG